MMGLDAAAAMTTQVDYGYPDAEAAAAATTRGQFDGVVFVDTNWEIAPVTAVLRIERLQDNWDGHGAPRISPRIGDVAIALIRQFGRLGIENLPEPFVAPAGDGGVTFEFGVGARELALAIHRDGVVSYLKSEAGEPFDEGIVLPLPGRLRELAAWLMSGIAAA